MLSVKKNKKSIHIEFSSAQVDLENALTAMGEFYVENEIDSYTKLEKITRELCTNASVHGNENDQSKKIQCNIHLLKNNRVKIMVTDEGVGFDTAKLTQEGDTGSDPLLSQHGLGLVRAVSDELVFERNGARVIAYCSVPGKIPFSVTCVDNKCTIKAHTDLVTTVAENFRTVLIRCLEQEHEKVIIDMEDVSNIDSVNLSLLIVFHNTIKNQGKHTTIELVHCTENVLNLFTVTRLSTVFQVRKDTVQADA